MNPNEVWQWMQWYQHQAPWILGTGAVGLLGLAALKHRSRQRQTPQQGRWATTRDLRTASLLSTSGFVLGRWGRWIIRYGGEGHMLVVASTRSGKTVSLVMPTLLEYTPQTSILVHDPKGELYACTAEYRATFSSVMQLAPCSRITAHYNPLDTIRLDTDYEVADTQLISEILVNPDGEEPQNETARHFLELTSDMLMGLILYGLRSGRGLTLAALNTLILNPWLQVMADLRLDPHPVVQQTVETFNRLDDKQHSGVDSTIKRALRLFNDPFIAAMTSHSDFKGENLRKGPQPLSIYISVPFNHIRRVRALTRLICRQLLDAALEQLDDWEFSLDVLLDEFPSIGRLNVLSDALSHAAGYGVRLCLITPGLADVIDVYGAHHKFLSGTQIQAYFGLNDEETAKRASGRLGNKMVTQERTTYHNRQRSVTRERVEKPLLSSDALLHLKPNNLVVIAGTTQVMLTQAPWYRTKPWKQRGVHVR